MPALPLASLRAAAQAVLRVPVIGVLLQAVRNYVLHQSANQAGSMAFSSLLAMFPLLLLASAAAAYVGQPGDASAFANRSLSYVPQVVRDALAPAVSEVLARRNQALLAVGLLVTLWTASSGMQAVRTALNRAYGVERGLPFWKARIKSTAFTVVVGSAVLFAFSSVVVMPYIWRALESRELAGRLVDAGSLRDAIRHAAAYLVVAAIYALMYAWLPDIRQRWRTVVPGALVGAALWVAAAVTLSYTLQTAGKLELLYGGFTGVVATLVFLYASATTLIYGAEVNAALRQADEALDPAPPVPPARS